MTVSTETVSFIVFWVGITLLIGYDMGKKKNTSNRTRSDIFAPKLSPYLAHTA